jgi:DNA-binding NarL/FixJ family response regulator
MITPLNILIVGDHPMLVDSYISIINSTVEDYKFNFIKAFNCESAFKQIELNFKTKEIIDIALLDVSLPPYEQEKILCGGDIAKLVRSKFPSCKIIMITGYHEALVINSIFKSIQPEGFIEKVDIDSTTFSEVFEKILKGESFISETINKTLVNLIRSNINWDAIDSKIITLLEKGIKTKDLPNYINLSLSAIEKRKAFLKTYLLEQKGSDKELIEKCKLLKLI